MAVKEFEAGTGAPGPSTTARQAHGRLLIRLVAEAGSPSGAGVPSEDKVLRLH